MANKTPPAPHTRLFVASLPPTFTAQDLRLLFSQAGEVTDAFVVMDRATNHSRGFGFCTMGSPKEAQAAIDVFRHEYNIERPHQSLGMAFVGVRVGVPR